MSINTSPLSTINHLTLNTGHTAKVALPSPTELETFSALIDDDGRLPFPGEWYLWGQAIDSNGGYFQIAPEPGKSIKLAMCGVAAKGPGASWEQTLGVYATLCAPFPDLVASPPDREPAYPWLAVFFVPYLEKLMPRTSIEMLAGLEQHLAAMLLRKVDELAA